MVMRAFNASLSFVIFFLLCSLAPVEYTGDNHAKEWIYKRGESGPGGLARRVTLACAALSAREEEVAATASDASLEPPPPHRAKTHADDDSVGRVRRRKRTSRVEAEGARSKRRSTSSKGDGATPAQQHHSPRKRRRFFKQCESTTMRFYRRAYNERYAVEREYWDALGLYNELETNFTKRSQQMEATLSMFEDRMESLEQDEVLLSHLAGMKKKMAEEKEEVEKQKTVMEVKRMALLVFDEDTWRVQGGEVVRECLDEAEAFRFFLLNGKTKEEEEEEEEQLRQERETEKKIYTGAKGEAAMKKIIAERDAMIRRAEMLTLAGVAKHAWAMALSTAFPPLYIFQQVSWAALRYHAWSYLAILSPFLEKHLSFLLLPSQRRANLEDEERKRWGAAAATLQLPDRERAAYDAGSHGTAASPSYGSFFFPTSSQVQYVVWLVCLVFGTLLVVMATLPLLLFVFYVRDILYHMMFCRFFLQYLCDFQTPPMVNPYDLLTNLRHIHFRLLSALLNLAAHIQQRWENRQDWLGSNETLICMQVVCLALPVTLFLVHVLLYWMRLHLALIW